MAPSDRFASPQGINGQKHVHSFKYQSVMLPNGILAKVEGRRHDCFLLRKSQLSKILALINPLWRPCIPCAKLYAEPYKGSLTGEQQQFNSAMSSVRECVEWALCGPESDDELCFFGFSEKNKILLQSVGKFYGVGTILANCHMCSRAHTGPYRLLLRIRRSHN